MRRFVDEEGRGWDVVIGRESWGGMVALFVPQSGEEVRQKALVADSHAEAQAMLDGATDEELRSLLAQARPKTN
ncbi:MAG: hypothetical protein P8099_00380 [Gemmatimonadota bacterium]|jgi:hypothetical protein